MPWEEASLTSGFVKDLEEAVAVVIWMEWEFFFEVNFFLLVFVSELHFVEENRENRVDICENDSVSI